MGYLTYSYSISGNPVAREVTLDNHFFTRYGKSGQNACSTPRGEGAPDNFSALIINIDICTLREIERAKNCIQRQCSFGDNRHNPYSLSPILNGEAGIGGIERNRDRKCKLQGLIFRLIE